MAAFPVDAIVAGFAALAAPLPALLLTHALYIGYCMGVSGVECTTFIHDVLLPDGTLLPPLLLQELSPFTLRAAAARSFAGCVA